MSLREVRSVLHSYAKVRLGGPFYTYTEGEYVREKLASRRGCTTYRLKYIKPGRKLLLCILPNGKTRGVALLRSDDVDLRTLKNRSAKGAIKKARKIHESGGKRD